jgi:hypothetical protein
MASFRLMHRATGVVLSGYVVLSATSQEIDTANANLSRSGSAFRYVDAASIPCLAPGSSAEANLDAQAS